MRPAPGSPLRGRYLVRNPGWNAWLHTRDLFLALATPRPREVIPPTTVRRVLLAVGGHLGDAVIATGLLPRIARAFPGARVGVLTGSWNRQVFQDHSLVDAIHVADHWKLIRAPGSLVAHWQTTRRTSAIAVGEIARAGYDVALDLSPYYPNASELLWRAGIPVRVGYTSGGGGPRYTHALTWVPGRHVAGDHQVLLGALRPEAVDASLPGYDLPPVPEEAARSAARTASNAGLTSRTYVVLHTGAGTRIKEWPAAQWRAIASALTARGVRVALTGAGPAQQALTASLASGLEGAANLCGQLGWDEFRWTLANARAVLSVDTVAMHLAAAAGTPTVAIMTGVDDPARWQPLGQAVTVLTERVSCAPCHRSRGCQAMTCIRSVTPAAVLAAAEPYLAR